MAEPGQGPELGRSDGAQVQQWGLFGNVGTHLWGGTGVSLS